MTLHRRLFLAAPLGLLGATFRAPGSVLASDSAAETVAAATEAPADSALTLINAYRAAAGAAPAQLHPALMRAAEGQVVYYDLNRGDASLHGMGLHRQEPDRPGFTGATMGERARNAGYSQGSVTENAGFGRIESAINWAVGTVNHRLPLLHPSALDMGYAVSGGPGGNGFNIVDVGLRRERLNPSAGSGGTVLLPSVFPGDGASGVPCAWDGGETPDPAPGVRRPLGYPVTVAFGVQQRVDWRVLALFGPDGQPLDVSTPKTDWMRAAAIIPHRPLAAGQTYTGHVEAVVDGKPVTKTWQFTTA